jgi:hypothetical protein
MSILVYALFFNVMLLTLTLYFMRRRVRQGRRKATF